MKEITVTLVSCEDGEWEGLYFADELICDRHHISAKDVLAGLMEFHEEKGDSVFIVGCDFIEAPMEYMEENDFPDSLEQLKSDIRK